MPKRSAKVMEKKTKQAVRNKKAGGGVWARNPQQQVKGKQNLLKQKPTKKKTINEE